MNANTVTNLKLTERPVQVIYYSNNRGEVRKDIRDSYYCVSLLGFRSEGGLKFMKNVIFWS